MSCVIWPYQIIGQKCDCFTWILDCKIITRLSVWQMSRAIWLLMYHRHNNGTVLRDYLTAWLSQDYRYSKCHVPFDFHRSIGQIHYWTFTWLLDCKTITRLSVRQMACAIWLSPYHCTKTRLRYVTTWLQDFHGTISAVNVMCHVTFVMVQDKHATGSFTQLHDCKISAGQDGRNCKCHARHSPNRWTNTVLDLH